MSRKFLWNYKLHKLPLNGKIDDLPIRLIVSNINTDTYQSQKHPAKVLSPLRESENNIKYKSLNSANKERTHTNDI